MVLFLRPRCRGLLIGSNGFVCFQSENGQMTEQSVTCESAVSKLLRYARVAGNNAALHHGFLRLSRNYGAASARSTILTGPLWAQSEPSPQSAPMSASGKRRDFAKHTSCAKLTQVDAQVALAANSCKVPHASRWQLPGKMSAVRARTGRSNGLDALRVADCVATA